ncbi:MAG: hypothetical protein R2827_15745 [Bdellovibrionales bacterium]
MALLLLYVDYTAVFNGLETLADKNSDYFIINNKNKILLSSNQTNEQTDFDAAKIYDSLGIPLCKRFMSMKAPQLLTE